MRAKEVDWQEVSAVFVSLGRQTAVWQTFAKVFGKSEGGGRGGRSSSVTERFQTYMMSARLIVSLMQRFIPAPSTVEVSILKGPRHLLSTFPTP